MNEAETRAEYIDPALAAAGWGKHQILLTLATGTGKTFIAFQIAWKMFQSRWNLSRERLQK
jgi:type I restriction enzyme R subunit